MFIQNSGSPLPSREQATEDTAPEGAAPEGDWHLPGRGPRQFFYLPAWLRSPRCRLLSLSLAVGLAAPAWRGGGNRALVGQTAPRQRGQPEAAAAALLPAKHQCLAEAGQALGLPVGNSAFARGYRLRDGSHRQAIAPYG